MGDPKRFDDYTSVVDCNECARYWDSSCDGVSNDSKRPCNSYLATRSVILPEKINKLEKRVKDLGWHIAYLYSTLILLVVLKLLGWF